MSDPIAIGWLIMALPLAAAILAAILSKTRLRTYANLPLIVACATAAIFAMILVSVVLNGDIGENLSQPVNWFAAGKLKVNYTINVDALSAMMLAMITFISTWIAVFSSGYMHGDKGFARFFAVMSLFVFSMCGLVLSNNLLFLLAFWEGVGLCSYLLIGYYYEKPSAAEAARKAFLVTRIGDTGFILGIFLLWKIGGFNTDISALFNHIATHPPEQWQLTTACLLLFCGAVGKSAQFPLYVWLPDAMEGPTPVSALIHAATMVTAGVYLLARCSPLFVRCPDVQIVVSSIGGFTAILAAFLALAQTDLKRVLAYSTVSQLGYMFLALGTGGVISPLFAVTAAMFHLFTHAFFKALLFLSAGSVMHAMGGVIDMRFFGGLRKLMPITHITFLCGAASLAALPLFSGFWSKDLILEAAGEAGHSASVFSSGYFTLMVVAFITAFMTAFYTFRAYFLTFWGPERIPKEAGEHAHESPSVMTIPLMVLAVGAVAVGIALEPFTHWFSDFMEHSFTLQNAARIAKVPPVERHIDWTIGLVGSALSLAGVGIAYAMYRKGESKSLPRPVEAIFAASRSKLYVDEAYTAAIVGPAQGLAFFLKVFDSFLDALTRLISAIPTVLGILTRPIQNGLVQFYALSMALGLAVFLAFVIFVIAR